MLNEFKDRWAEELPSMLWMYHTTPRTSTNEIPFNLVFGTEVVIPVEIELLTMQIKCYDELSNPVQLKANLDLLKTFKIKPTFGC